MKFYFAGGGYLGGGDPLWGSPPIIEALDLFLAMLGDTQVPWAVAVLGGSLLDTPIARAALERGGHLRVGIEDWDDGPSNLEQVEAAVACCAKPDARSRRSPKLSISWASPVSRIAEGSVKTSAHAQTCGRAESRQTVATRSERRRRPP